MKRKTTSRLICAAIAIAFVDMSAVTAKGAPGDLIASVSGDARNGGGFIYEYTPNGVQSTFASGLSRPRGLALDSLGNLLVATNFCDPTPNRFFFCRATIMRITPDGAQDVFADLPGDHIAQGTAIDPAGNLFVMTDSPHFTFSKIYQLTPEGKRQLFAVLPLQPSQGFGLAFDSAGNLFAADALNNTIYRFAPDGTRSVFVGPEAFTDPAGAPFALAFDLLGNLFVTTNVDPFTDDKILEFTPSGAKSTFATGLHSPRGLAFDSAGNLFVAERPVDTTGDIVKITPDGTPTVFASGIGRPQGNGGPDSLLIRP
jgi:DNA-binding beta-propeller fold protein YncE